MTTIAGEVSSSNSYTSFSPQMIEVLIRLQQHAIDKMPTNIYIYDLVDQCIVYSSKSVLELLGYEGEALHVMQAQNTAESIHPEDLEVFASYLPSLANLSPGEIIQIDYRMKGADGEYHWLRSQETALFRADNGYPLQVLGITQDLSQNNLGAAYPAFSELLAALPQMVTIANRDGVITYVNCDRGSNLQQWIGESGWTSHSQPWQSAESFQGDFVDYKNNGSLFSDSKKTMPILER